MKAVRLSAEYLQEPVGIDIVRPRLSWNCEDGIRQTAYQIIAKANGEIVWNSGRVESSSMTHIPYEGRALKSRERVNWSVKLWDENGNGGEISHSFFEMGLLDASDWKAKWITGNYRVKKSERYPVDCFRKKLSVAKEVKSARLYITACGLYEAKLDGEKIGSFCLAPGHTDYRKRVQYQTYDVTEMLTAGDHALTVMLADGWYRGGCGAWGIRNQYGIETKLLAQMEICYTDGTGDTIVSDESWDWSNDGPIRFADNKDGEVVDANREPSYDGKAKVTKHRVVPCASNNVAVIEHERFTPIVSKAPNGRWLLDFGQNIAGYIAFRILGKENQRLTFRFGELRDYKFFCFHGEPKLLFIATDRQTAGEETKFDFFDMDFQHLDLRNGHPNAAVPPEKPVNFEKMRDLAAVLSQDIPHLRVDFYEVNGKVYFGELTFSHWSGMVPFDPPEWDRIMGDWIILPEK